MSEAKIKDIFDSSGKSVGTIFRQKSAYFLPVYQRQYDWPVENIDKLIEDIALGFYKLSKSKDAYTFLGTIICIQDNENRTVQPSFKPELPEHVMSVIDGQQRMTTLILLISVLFDEIRLRQKKIEKLTDEHVRWLGNHVRSILADLSDCLVFEKFGGDDLACRYPKITRAIEDIWSTNDRQFKYTSPIGRYLSHHIRSIFNDDLSFKYEARADGRNKNHMPIILAVKKIRSLLAKIVIPKKTEEDDYGYFNAISIISNSQLTGALFNDENPQSAKEYLVEEEGDTKRAVYAELLQLTSFAKFLLQRVALTAVVAKTEDYAFDMFESLNSTGEPLTALQTFKPLIVKDIGEEHFEASEARGHFEAVEQYLMGFPKRQRGSATEDFLVSFALLQSGEKISKKLNDQRKFLNNSYENAKNGGVDPAVYTSAMGSFAEFLRQAWPKNTDNACTLPNDVEISEEALTALEMLRRAKHTIVQPLLYRFFSEIDKGSDEAHKSLQVQKFEKIILAVSAFSSIWRTSRPTTEGIEQIYRNLMGTGDPAQSISPVCLRPNEGASAASLNGVCKYLMGRLEHAGISDAAGWAKLLKRNNAYKSVKDFTRFVMFVGTNDMVPDPTRPGFLQEGTPKSNEMLTPATWNKSAYLTVEHVAPQSAKGSYPDDVYADLDTVHTIGNMTLLPQQENTLIADRPWPEKRAIFDFLAEKVKAESDKKLSTLETEGIKLSTRQQEILSNADYLLMCGAISNYDGEWSKEIIDARTDEFAENAWHAFSSWLLKN